MLSHDANNDDAGMMIKRSQRALQIEMPTLFFSSLFSYLSVLKIWVFINQFYFKLEKKIKLW
jgi:hypothetical protein